MIHSITPSANSIPWAAGQSNIHFNCRAEYTYDRFGNRERMVYTGVNAAESYTTDYEYHPNNWLLTETKQMKDIREVFRYQYDKNGSQCYREWEKLEPALGDSPGQVHFEKGTAKKDTILELRAYNGFGQLTWLYRDGAATFYRYRPDGLRHQKRTGADTTSITIDTRQGVAVEYITRKAG